MMINLKEFIFDKKKLVKIDKESEIASEKAFVIWTEENVSNWSWICICKDVFDTSYKIKNNTK